MAPKLVVIDRRDEPTTTSSSKNCNEVIYC